MIAKSIDKLRILLIQIRGDQESSQEEYDEFVRFSGLQSAQIDVLNVYQQSDFSSTLVDNYDALFVGGSSDASVLEPDRYPSVYGCCRLLRYCYDRDIPVFASCFGFQLAVIEFGGRVILDKPNMEMGTYEILLSDNAKTDPLFRDYPDRFWAISGHKERADRLPNNAILLAYSDLCPFHAFRLKDKPFYAFQFHPEVDPPDLKTRITRYQHRYFEHTDALDRVFETQQSTDLSNGLVKRFIDVMFAQQQLEGCYVKT